MSAPDVHMTLKNIQKLTGHESTDAIRMALHRANIKSCGAEISLTSWPPNKTYSSIKVWNLFSARILKNVSEDESLKDNCWYYFGYQIREASAAASVGNLFDDKIQ